MHSSVPRRLAEQLYYSGHALYQQGRYVEALAELQQAEVAFREHEAHGHPFSHPLSNGISGLANALSLTASCYQNLGDYKAAVTCYETSLINSTFEKKKASGTFRKKLIEEISFSYEKLVEEVEQPERERLLKAVPPWMYPSCSPTLFLPASYRWQGFMNLPRGVIVSIRAFMTWPAPRTRWPGGNQKGQTIWS